MSDRFLRRFVDVRNRRGNPLAYREGVNEAATEEDQVRDLDSEADGAPTARQDTDTGNEAAGPDRAPNGPASPLEPSPEEHSTECGYAGKKGSESDDPELQVWMGVPEGMQWNGWEACKRSDAQTGRPSRGNSDRRA